MRSRRRRACWDAICSPRWKRETDSSDGAWRWIRSTRPSIAWDSPRRRVPAFGLTGRPSDGDRRGCRKRWPIPPGPSSSPGWCLRHSIRDGPPCTTRPHPGDWPGSRSTGTRMRSGEGSVPVARPCPFAFSPGPRPWSPPGSPQHPATTSSSAKDRLGIGSEAVTEGTQGPPAVTDGVLLLRWQLGHGSMRLALWNEDGVVAEASGAARLEDQAPLAQAFGPYLAPVGPRARCHASIARRPKVVGDVADPFDQQAEVLLICRLWS